MRNDDHARINAFLANAATLRVTHVRRPAPVDGVEQFVRKLLSQVLRRRPATEAEVQVLKLPARGAVTHPAADAGLSGLDLFAARHQLGQNQFRVRMKHLPGAGAGVAGAALQLAKVDRPDITAAADSVLRQGFADAFAVYSIAITHGPSEARRLAEDALIFRDRSGDFGVFSRHSLSQDTEVALRFAVGDLDRLDEISHGVAAERAMVAAHENLREWMRKHGAHMSLTVEALIEDMAARLPAVPTPARSAAVHTRP